MVGRRNAAAATAFAREVSGVKNPVPSPRAESTSRPASSTTVIVIGEPMALALACAARSTFSASSSVMSIIGSPFPRNADFDSSERANLAIPRTRGVPSPRSLSSPQRPWKDGGRFSTKARMPSRASSVSEHTFWAKVSNSSAERRSTPSPW